MGRLHHLGQSLPLLATQPGLQCIVVDYGCPDHAGAWVEQNFPGVLVVRAGAVAHFNASKARNLGAPLAQTQWLCFLDADTLVGPAFATDVTQGLRARTFFLADPCPHEMCGMVVCRRDDFFAIGGYDELFTGWGAQDRDLYLRLQLSGCKQAGFPAGEIRMITHGDDERTRHHEIRERFLSLRINGMYLQMKTDLARLTGVAELDLVDRQELYARIRQRVLADPRAAARVDVTLPRRCDFTQPPDWRLARTISYCFEPLHSNAP